MSKEEQQAYWIEKNTEKDEKKSPAKETKQDKYDLVVEDEIIQLHYEQT
jgi:hypothetical protein